MSDDSGFNRWFIVTVAIVVGFLIGLAFAIYLVYAWVPANIILRDAPPAFLRFDPTGQSPQYRDVYVARVANRYAQAVQGGQPDAALTQAQQALGVATGDATPLEALAMARSAEQAARVENASLAEQGNPDAGWFTIADQNNITMLAERLDQVREQPVTVAQSVLDARRNAAILGFVLLLLWVALLAGLLALIANWLKPATVVVPAAVAPAATGPGDALQPPSGATVTTTTTTTTQRSIQTGAEMPVAQPGAPVVVAPTEPGLASPLQTPSAVRVASPVAGEMLINTFPTSYQHGEDRYDEGFQISASSGELIGECGASIADRAGLVSPSRVTALAIWVFDKNDFLSTNKVLLTPYAYRDDVMRSKLASRGELVLAKPGMFEINTSTLRVEVEVRNLRMQPLDGDPDGYFERVDLDFRVFRKP